MPADAPTILATSGGRIDGRRTPWEVGPLTEYAVELARVSGRRPRVCFLATALGDNAAVLQAFYDAARFAGFEASHLALFPMPNVDDPRGHLLAQDVVWVSGGSVAGLLACGGCTGSTPSCAGRGRPAWSWPGSRPGPSAGTSAGPPTPSAPSCGRSPTGWACCPTPTASTTTRRSSAGRWCTVWSPTDAADRVRHGRRRGPALPRHRAGRGGQRAPRQGRIPGERGPTARRSRPASSRDCSPDRAGRTADLGHGARPGPHQARARLPRRRAAHGAGRGGPHRRHRRRGDFRAAR